MTLREKRHEEHIRLSREAFARHEIVARASSDGKVEDR